MKTQINIKIDSHIKRSAQKRAKEIGLPLSAIVNATLSQFARTGELHITPAYTPTPYLRKILDEAEAEYVAGKTSGPFHSVEELIADIEK